ncbi:MAG: DUF885 domain-containing protein [Pseudomonadales bacterium]
MTISKQLTPACLARSISGALVLLLATLAGSCTSVAPPAAQSPESPIKQLSADERWDALVDGFLHDYFEQVPSAGVRAGRHQYDGRIPDLSATGTASRVAAFKQHQRAADEFSIIDLSRDRQFEREVMIWYLGRQLFWLEVAQRPKHNPMYFRGAIDPSTYLSSEYAPLAVRMAALTQLLQAVPSALEQIRSQLDEQIAASFLKRSISYYGGLARHLESTVDELFSETGSADERQRLQQNNGAAISALRAFESELRALESAAHDEFALGAELFARMLLDTEMVGVPLAELKTRGAADLARNLQALKGVCAGDLQTPDLPACMALAEKQKSLDPVARGAQQLQDLKQFVVDHDLVTIPSKAEALVKQSPPYNRANLAYIRSPGPFEPNSLPSIYYISPPDPTWSEEVQRAFVPNEGRLLYVSVHEVWPGHFLWGQHRNRAKRPLVRLFRSTTASEGWAHYAEEMMHDAGLGDADSLLHVGQLANALKRNVRYLSAIGLHTEGMTLAQSQAMFLEQGMLDLGNARQQAARGTYDPSYLSYTLGKLQIMDLREAWLAEDDERTLKQFHDTLLSYGGAPITLVRRYMLGAP